jgi:hypothetical protein
VTVLETELRKMVSGLSKALDEYAPDAAVQPTLYRWWEEPKQGASMQKLTRIPRHSRFHAVEQAIIKDRPDAVGLVIPARSEPVDDGLEQVNFVICDREQNVVGAGVTIKRSVNEPPSVESALKADGFSGGAVECLKRGMMLAHALADGDQNPEPPSAGQ